MGSTNLSPGSSASLDVVFIVSKAFPQEVLHSWLCLPGPQPWGWALWLLLLVGFTQRKTAGLGQAYWEPCHCRSSFLGTTPTGIQQDTAWAGAFSPFLAMAMPTGHTHGRLECKSLQIRGHLSVLPLFCLCNCHTEALQPLFCILLILGLENVGFIVCEDFKSPRERAVSAFLGHSFHTLYLAELYRGIFGIIFHRCCSCLKQHTFIILKLLWARSPSMA